MNIKPIRTKTDYKAALKAVESLMGAKARSPQGEQLDVHFGAGRSAYRSMVGGQTP